MWNQGSTQVFLFSVLISKRGDFRCLRDRRAQSILLLEILSEWGLITSVPVCLVAYGRCICLLIHLFISQAAAWQSTWTGWRRWNGVSWSSCVKPRLGRVITPPSMRHLICIADGHLFMFGLQVLGTKRCEGHCHDVRLKLNGGGFCWWSLGQIIWLCEGALCSNTLSVMGCSDFSGIANTDSFLGNSSCFVTYTQFPVNLGNGTYWITWSWVFCFCNIQTVGVKRELGVSSAGSRVGQVVHESSPVVELASASVQMGMFLAHPSYAI